MLTTMKKLVAIAALLSAAYMSYGQGEVIFSTGSQFCSTNTTGTPGRLSGAGNYLFALFVAPTTVNTVNGMAFDDPNWTFTGDYGTNIATAGRILGNYSANATAIIPGYAPGSTGNFLVIGWSVNIPGADLSQSGVGVSNAVVAVRNWFHSLGAGLIGQSGIATILVGGGTTPLSTLFGAVSGSSIQGFSLVPVPEPATFTLAGLGAATLLIVRRRRI